MTISKSIFYFSIKRAMASLVALGSLSVSFAYAAQNEEGFFDLSLESLSQLIVTASRYEEKLFDAPMAASVVTGEQILRSGATNIPEALRLIPGVIVREQTNGNYDVHIRGLDNVPPGSFIVRNTSNNLTLVMIDNRIIYNHSTGGTFWEMLPISLIDVERIEVVKGAASALYGPNAVTGVIHIFTKDPASVDHALAANAQAGSHNTVLLDADSQFDIGTWSGRFSLNSERRDRQSNCYVEYISGDCFDDPADITETPLGGGDPLYAPDQKYPDINNAQKRMGFNVFLSGEALGAANQLSIGYQDSEVQKIYDDNVATPITTVDADSWYLSLNSQWQRLQFHGSIEQGESNTLGSPAFDIEYQNLDFGLNASYDVARWGIQPLLQYRRQEMDGTSYGKEESMDIYSAGIRVEYRLNDWRFSSAVRGDHYGFSSETEGSYFLGITYKGINKWLFRGSVGRAAQEPFMLFVFEDLAFNTLPGNNSGVTVFGNEDIDVVTVDNIELGTRWLINGFWSLDAELFSNTTEDYQSISISVFPAFTYNNLPLEAEQKGATVSLMYTANYLTGNVFATVQRTDFDQGFTDENENTPDYYGGFSVNYSGWDRVNMNVSGYFYQHNKQVILPTLASGDVSEVKSKFLVNAKVDYQLSNTLTVFINARNLFNDDEREFALADEVGSTVFLGVNWVMK